MPTILIVDDRATNREFLVTLLGYSGHSLLEASDGAEALATAKAVHLDLVIADILMPTMDGYEFVRLLRAEPDLAGIPVIFYTAHYHENEARRLAEACGVTHILRKPSEPEVVLSTVNAALGVAPLTAGATAIEEFDREHLRLMTDKLSQKAEELRKTNERLEALIDLSLQLGSERDPRRLLQSFCHAARTIIGARYARVGIVGDANLRLRHLVTSGMDAVGALRLGSPPLEQGPIHTVLTDCRCVRLQNPGGDPAALGFPASHPPIHSWLGAPIVSPKQVYGWLCLVDKVGAEGFSDEDERLAGVLAAQVGRIYENGSLYADLLLQTSDLHQEIEERKRVEEERDRFFTQSPNLKYVAGFDGYFRRTNPAWEAILGYTSAELLPEPFISFVHPEDRATILVKLQRLAAGEVAAALEVRCRHKDGSYRWILWNATPFLDQSCFYSNGEDITRRKQLEEQVRQTEQRLQHVLASSPAVLYSLEAEGETISGLVWISENVRTMLGYDAEEALLPNWWQENLHPDDADRVMDDVQQKLFAKGSVASEFRFRHRSGSFRWIRSETRLLRDEVGHPLEAIGSWSDITHLRQLEEQFRQAQKMEAVGSLAGGVAHDFNNLLTVINGYSEFVMDSLKIGDPLREMVDQIRKAGDRATGLTRQLLAFSRKQVMVPVVLDLNALVLEMEKMLRRLIGEDIDLQISPAPGLWKVKTDMGQMEQVLLNLIVNARDAMPQGGKLTIETANVEQDESYCSVHPNAKLGSFSMLALTDTGTGMDNATKSRIFEPFFTTKGPEKGTGLGLATVWGIVQQSEGHVEVYSELGVGTTFKIYLPRTKEESEGPQAAPAHIKPSRGTETILLVEDEERVRALARLVLQSNGYTVLEAKNGSEALIVAHQFTAAIDLMVTDVVMPNMSGRQLAERMTTVRPQTKVLYVSGYTDDAVVRHGIVDSKTPFLQKPFSPLSFVRKVREVLDGG